MDKDSILRAAELMAEQIENPSIQPEPVPTSVSMNFQDDFIVLTFTTLVGKNTFFLDLDGADQLADAIKKTVITART